MVVLLLGDGFAERSFAVQRRLPAPRCLGSVFVGTGFAPLPREGKHIGLPRFFLGMRRSFHLFCAARMAAGKYTYATQETVDGEGCFAVIWLPLLVAYCIVGWGQAGEITPESGKSAARGAHTLPLDYPRKP